MSFSSLPPELVHQIVESTVPNTYHCTTYQERQRTLCSLSLVSKLFRSIAQPFLFEIVELANTKGAVKLPSTRALEGTAPTDKVIQWLIIKDGYPGQREQNEEGRVAKSLHVFETARSLTLSCLEKRIVTSLLSVNSSHLTYLQLSSLYWRTTNIFRLPSLISLTLFDVPLELSRSLLNTTAIPKLRNFVFIESSEEPARFFEEPSINHCLLQLETLHLDGYYWLGLDASFRQSVASRTLVNVESLKVETVCHPKSLIVHARLDRVVFLDSPLYGQNFNKTLDDWISFMRNTTALALQSLYLDSSFQVSSALPLSVHAKIDDLTHLCLERKIDLVFEKVPINDDLDPLISAEFIRRQKPGREVEAQGDEATRRW